MLNISAHAYKRSVRGFWFKCTAIANIACQDVRFCNYISNTYMEIIRRQLHSEMTEKHLQAFTHFSLTDGMCLVLGAMKKVSIRRCYMLPQFYFFSLVINLSNMCVCYLGRGSLLCSGLGCQSSQQCQRATGLPSSRTSARQAPTSLHWTLKTHTRKMHCISNKAKERRKDVTKQKQITIYSEW